MDTTAPSLDDVRAAAARIAPHAVRTPVLRSAALDAAVGAHLHFKCENLQRGGAFKFRGACNAVMSLDAANAARGVVTQSSGNHGTAIAIAARVRGIPAHVVVPANAPAIKLAQIREQGARVILCEPTLAARNAACAAVQEQTGAELIHPYDDARVIAGQGTAALELVEQAGPFDAVIAPVSGGGLLSGTAIATHGLDPGVRVLGGEPAQAADAHASLRRGALVTDIIPDTIADGLRAQLCARTYAILRAHAVEVLLAGEDGIVAAMRLVWDRLKLVVEPSGAVALAALIAGREGVAGLRIGVILSGGNVDLDRLPWQEPRFQRGLPPAAGGIA
ncbi:MAG TPA: pyridoxal-phosphate dependent enzyme [Pseudomonadota bacterium]|nr:pyridoxal-phosphate dependent enzyme [Pseudomonadota bacterium]HQX26155.1 pyridoxal-phosphate dependent enzyme [Pseudomonadota bacterium]HQY37725.1 pyridoxal-phosphate dependent enzyme [Pseudomonadota bacterium]HRA37892.1 pyridoxal-phosphate dependent enzyme [Pseudomonadota bacterium]